MKGNKISKAEVGLVEWFRVGEYDHVEKVIQDIRELGIKKLRTGMSWADSHTKEGFPWFDYLFDKLSGEVEILPCFLYTPPSVGEQPKTSSPPKNLQEYSHFVDQIITRYGQHFEWVELWNEPNNLVEYDFTLDPNWNKFVTMIAGAAKLARKKGKKTLLGGMSPFDPNWLNYMFRKGLMKYIDAVGLHGFPEVFDQAWTSWDYIVDTTKDILDEHGCDAQIWITEAGFSTWQHDEHRQLEEFRKAVSTQADRVYWYASMDLDPSVSTVSGFHLDDREYFFGLKKNDGTPKLLFRLLAEQGIEGLFEIPYVQKKTCFQGLEPYALITGGAGFVGTNLAKSLMEQGKRVMIYDNLSRPGVEKNLEWLHHNYPDQLEINVADILNIHSLKKAVECSTEVYHLAGQVAVTTSLNNPVNDFQVNAQGTLNVLESIRALKKPVPLIFTSTNKVYGSLPDIRMVDKGKRYSPVDENIRKYGLGENLRLDFHSPYGCSKGTADQYVLDYARTYNIPATVFRMSCIYGPHQYGTEDQGWVAHFIIRALEEKDITIYGDGKQVRDILYVEDLVNAFITAKNKISKVSGQAFNIGGGVNSTTSLLELIDTINNKLNTEVEVNFDEARPGDQLYYVSDTRHFMDATGWRPKFSKEEGVENIFRWLMKTRGMKTKPIVKKELVA